MKIAQDTIDRIHQSLDIYEVVSDFVNLKKKGQYWTACCPFHNEKTPSFYVTPAKGIYKCFGCGKAGDTIQFVMDMEGLSYMETMKFLAKKYGIEISEEEQSKEEVQRQNERDSLLIALNYASTHYKNILFNHEDGQAIGLSYFKERGFSEKTIKKFDLGYSLDEWDGLLKQALKDGYQTDILEKAGLILQRENANDSKASKFYDRFRGRVVFPIHNVTGKVIAFGARILKADKNQPKYLNSPETEVYHKSKILYGIFQAKQPIRQEDNCFLVEGYTDVISLHQAGIENVVASSGTSLTEDQIKLIKRYTDNITVLYDGDPAGIKASLRGIDMILEAGMNVHAVVFPDGDDPDSYVKKIGSAEFINYVKASRKDFITFKTELVLKEIGNDPIKKAGVIKDIVVSISKIPDSIKRAVFFKQCSLLMDIDEQVIISEYNKIHIANNKKKETSFEDDFYLQTLPDLEEDTIPEVTDKNLVLQSNHEKEIIKLFLNYASSEMEESGSLAEYLITEIQDIDFRTPKYKKMLEVIRETYEKGGQISEAMFMGYEDEEIRKEAIDMMVGRYELSTHWEKFQIHVPKDEELLPLITPKSVLRLKRIAVRCLIQENLQEIKKAETEEEISELLMIAKELKKVSDEINAMLGITVG